MMKYILHIIFAAFSIGVYGQQDILTTHFMYNKLALNPAYAGKDETFTLNLIHRDQWTGLDGAPRGQALSLNFPEFKGGLGLGLNVGRESIGIQERLTLEGNYSYKFDLAEGSLSMGLSASTRQFTNDFSDPRLVALQGIDIDPAISGQRESKNVFNAGAGVYFRTNTYYVGVSVPRLIRADLDFDTDGGTISSEVRHLYIMTGAAFPLKDKLKFTPQVLFRLAENSPFDLDLNFGLDYDEKYYGAINFRAGGGNQDIAESIDVLFGFQITKSILLGISYDYTLSDISQFENGTIEALFNYRFAKKVKEVDIINPRFF